MNAECWFSACEACRAVGPLPLWALWRWAHDAGVPRVGLGLTDVNISVMGCGLRRGEI